MKNLTAIFLPENLRGMVEEPDSKVGELTDKIVDDLENHCLGDGVLALSIAAATIIKQSPPEYQKDIMKSIFQILALNIEPEVSETEASSMH